ncbi:Oxidoreductase, short-chain dehydrogenase/reductase family [Candidatus Syntrophocurvum alkaliphilum]|uniref:Oxidoreductase, short-chain dehydrogenase/reductase family n=1 Tax=Candidatus Syntrophocurvum alkaliphilum TaxID=2293317 RepID=A0A6I6DG52_9FIRM|nr:glucose 1-dehydrogenase [Candidatus Syntrophocurvum alkaliphilum]QGT98669.1 Oxidoreductase, short-chain dehydrogenase/reductase family [Candidatus Syntrophocurvum alkaliphilum]
MSKKLQGKVAIITGAGSGMGRAIGILFAKEGAKVVLADYNAQTVAETSDIITQHGGKSIALTIDMAHLNQIESLIYTTIEQYSKLDILVNNAGIFDESKVATEIDEAFWDKILDVNLKGPFWACKLAIPHMIKNGNGSIVNIASIAGLIGGAGGAAYTTSKHGLLGLTKQISVSYGPKGIKANAICPGAIQTGMLPEESLSDESNPLLAKIMNVPSRRVGKAEEIANATLFLASNDSDFIQGQSLTVDGGWLTQA